jgi:hypothetical protein
MVRRFGLAAVDDFGGLCGRYGGKRNYTSGWPWRERRPPDLGVGARRALVWERRDGRMQARFRRKQILSAVKSEVE